MKKIISLALVLVMAMALLTACGVELKAPEGLYATESGAYTVEFKDYDAKANKGTLTVTLTITDPVKSVTGTFTVVQNGDEEDSFIIDFTPENGETIKDFMVYGVKDNVVAQYASLPDIDGKNSSYYAVKEDADDNKPADDDKGEDKTEE